MLFDPRYLEQRINHRAARVRRAVLLTPSALLATGLLLYALPHLPASTIMVIIVGAGAIALDIEAISALRDLRAQPVTTRGRIGKLWKKTRFMVFGRVDYMLIGRKLFEIGAVTAMELRPGDEVIVEHWPHSRLLITLERAPAERAPAERDPR